MFYRILFIVHYAHRRTIGLQRYNKKCTYASKASFFLKKSSEQKYGLHFANVATR